MDNRRMPPRLPKKTQNVLEKRLNKGIVKATCIHHIQTPAMRPIRSNFKTSLTWGSPVDIYHVSITCWLAKDWVMNLVSLTMYLLQIQTKGREIIENQLEENLEQVMSHTTFNGCCKVVDLGCSSGPNTLIAISNIINMIDKISMSLNHEPPVFQIYLNDLFGNDFSSIFKLLPDFYQSIQQERGDKARACFINATPGNFYGRLFPNNYINFFHSSYSVHWLSQAPKDLTKKGEPLNKGNIYITRTSSLSVYDAYFKKFEGDFKCFLESRSMELISGGMMVLTFIGRETTSEITFPYEALAIALNEMVREGLVEEAKLDLFDLPKYHPTIEEVTQVIETEGSFTLQTSKTFKIGWDANLHEDIIDYVVDSKMRGEYMAKYLRAIFEPLLSVEFGENIMDELFSRFAKLVAQLIELETLEFTNIVLFMTKDH